MVAVTIKILSQLCLARQRTSDDGGRTTGNNGCVIIYPDRPWFPFAVTVGLVVPEIEQPETKIKYNHHYCVTTHVRDQMETIGYGFWNFGLDYNNPDHVKYVKAMEQGIPNKKKKTNWPNYVKYVKLKERIL